MTFPPKKWLTTLAELELLQLINQPTRVQQNSKSLLDHIYTTKASNIMTSATKDIGLSDHSIVFAIRKLGSKNPDANNRKKITYFDWRKFSPEAFQNTLKNTNWDKIYLCRDVNPMLGLFTDILNSIIATHLPKKSKFVRSTILPPWLDAEVRQNIIYRDHLKRSGQWHDYKKQRNRTTNLIRNKKKEHITQIINKANNKQTKELWRTLRNTDHKNTLPSLQPDTQDNRNQLANDLNNHFAKMADTLTNNLPSPSAPSILKSDTPIINHMPTLTTDEVVLLFKDISPAKATGIDNLSVRLIRLALPFILKPLTDILNKAITSAIFPKQWKTAIVTPLYKGGDSHDFSNYRPISVLPILSKLLERHIHTSLLQHLTVNNIISHAQSGFRKFHSCTTAMHKMYSSWIDSKNEKHKLVILSLDFKKAFDTVSHEILIKKLANIGIQGKLLQLIKSFLSERQQCVKVHNTISNFLPMKSGVPQGSILSPTLFQIFINDLLNAKLHSTVHAYADDTTFYLSNNSLSQLQQNINNDLKSIHHWCTQNRMLINLKKSHYLLVNTTKHQTLKISINNEQLKQQTSSKIIGFTINDSLNWGNHIDNIHSKISTNLRLLYNIKHLLHFNTAKQYYNNYIHPYLSYGIHMYFPLSPYSLTNLLYLLQKKALRTICSIVLKPERHKTLSTPTASKLTNTLPLPDLAKFVACQLAHTVNNNTCPPYIKSLFKQTHHSHATRHLHKLPSSSGLNKLNHFILTSFNSLPMNIRQSPKTAFKKSLKNYLLLPAK